jgi:hypothetical protein
LPAAQSVAGGPWAIACAADSTGGKAASSPVSLVFGRLVFRDFWKNLLLFSKFPIIVNHGILAGGKASQPARQNMSDGLVTQNRFGQLLLIVPVASYEGWF